MVSTIKDAKCIRCKREPSSAGLESMFLIPSENYRHVVYCGVCFRNLLARCGLITRTSLDYSNLFNGFKSEDIYVDKKS